MGEYTQEFSSILTKEREVNQDFFDVIGWVSDGIGLIGW